MTRPSASTAVSASTFSLIVPYRTAVVPDARVAVMPPIVASAPGSTGNIRPGVAERLVQLQAGHAGFDRRVEILDADAHDAIQIARVDRDAAAQRLNVSFERRACAERHDGQVIARADADDLDDFVDRLRKADDVGRRGRVIRLAVTVMLADRVRIAGARTRAVLSARQWRQRPPSSARFSTP